MSMSGIEEKLIRIMDRDATRGMPKVPTVEVELSNDHWAVMRTKLTFGDMRALSRARERAKDKGPFTDEDAGAVLAASLIDEWSFECTPSDKALDMLTADDVAKLMEVVAEAGAAQATEAGAPPVPTTVVDAAEMIGA